MRADVLEYARLSSPTVYYEKRHEGVRRFTIIDGRLCIWSNWGVEGNSSTPIPLSTISPAYSVVRERSRIFYFAIFMLNTMIAVGMLTDKWMNCLVGAGVALVLIAITCRKRTVYRFRYLHGKHAFDIWKAGPERSRVERFVESVVAETQLHSGGQGPK